MGGLPHNTFQNKNRCEQFVICLNGFHGFCFGMLKICNGWFAT
jgi:hypothetical protein